MRHLIRKFTWFNIVIQFLFPLAAAFTPAIAGAGSEKKLLQSSFPSLLPAMKTQVYTLGAGESAASVAARFNMSVESLQQLNSLRTFSRGFNHLQAGDEIDVPLAPLPEIVWDNQGEAGNDWEKNLAGIASRAGSFLANGPNSDTTAAMAKGMATQAAGSEIQDFLSNFGTARIQLDVDKKLSLKNSQLDLLVPLYDSADRMVFTQGSVHRTDDRNQSNLGLGIRHFAAEYMLGGNLFGDYDLSRDHARAGVGAEYWRDFIKLSANGYFRLTNWKDSPDLRDYEERPANGWDIRTQGWLPSLPQLGGKLTWEQYYGKEVALFGKDNRQRNPYAVTAGVDYTPVPLVTLSAEQRQGQSGKNDTRLGLGLNYRIGTPWRHQVDPGMVATMRTLNGSRYDLVDRNNNIVLEYRQQSVLHISLPEIIEVESAGTVRLPVTVQKSRYGVKDTEWTPSPAFVEQGGTLQKISATEMEFRVPAYTYTRNAAQDYALSAVSVDNNGNRSNTVTSIIRVVPSTNAVGSLAITPDTAVPADNRQSMALTATVTDSSGTAAVEQSLTFSVAGLTDAQNNPAATLFTETQSDNKTLTVKTDDTGKAVVNLRSTVANKGTVTVRMENGSTKTAEVSFVADAGSAAIAALEVTKDNAHADGVSANELEALILDAHGNPLADFTVEADVDNDGVIDASAITDTNGRTTLKVTNERAGETNISVRSGGAQSRVIQTATVKFVVDKTATHIDDGDLKVSSGAKANGVEANTVAVKVTDIRGNIAAGVTVEIAVANGEDVAVVTQTSSQTDSSGMVNATITSQKAGEYTVNAVIRESGFVAQVPMQFVADEGSASIKESHLVVTTGAKANGQESNAVTATVTDALGNPVQNMMVTFTADNTAVQFANTALVTGDDGVATTTMRSAVAGSFAIMAALADGQRVTKETVFVADADTALITENNLIVTSGATADGIDNNTVTATVTDAMGNVIANVEVQLKADDPAVVFNETTLMTNSDGVVTTGMSATKSGSYMVIATAGNSPSETRKQTEFVAGAAVAANSLISIDKQTYTSGDDMQVTVQLRDRYGNAVIGQTALLDTQTVTVASAQAKAGSEWQESANKGEYTRLYVTDTAYPDLYVTLQLAGWDNRIASEKYSIVLGEITPKGILVNGHTFESDAGFPSIGFTGAEFSLVLSEGSVTDYYWESSNDSAASVMNGHVIIGTSGRTANAVTITGTPKNNTGSVVKYSYSLKQWIINGSKHVSTWYQINEQCQSVPSASYRLATRNEVTLMSPSTRTVGGLFNEWGPLGHYSTAQFEASSSDDYYWLANIVGSSFSFVNLRTGTVMSTSGSREYYTMCITDL